MDLKQQKELLETIKKCQRNWDKTFVIPEDHIEHFVHLATNSPTKQYEAYFNLYVITDEELLEELFDHTWGFTFPINNDTSTAEVPSCARNPQMNANAYFLWTAKYPDTLRNFERDGKEKDNKHANRRDNAFTSIGISMGIVAFSAASLGYSTGFNKNHSKPNFPGHWRHTLGIEKNEEIAYGLGIGKPKPGYKSNETDEHKLLIGWPNTEIVDLKTTRTYKYNDREYILRESFNYPRFSLQPRNIQVKRF